MLNDFTIMPITAQIPDKESNNILKRTTKTFAEFFNVNKHKELSFEEFYEKYAIPLKEFVYKYNPVKDPNELYVIFNKFFMMYGFYEVTRFPVRYNNYILYISYKLNNERCCSGNLTIDVDGINEPDKGCNQANLCGLLIDTEDTCPMFEIGYDLWKKANTIVVATIIDSTYYKGMRAMEHYKEFGRFPLNQEHLYLDLDTMWSGSLPRVKCMGYLENYYSMEEINKMVDYKMFQHDILWLAKYKVVNLGDGIPEKEIFIWCKGLVEEKFCNKICSNTMFITTYNENNAIKTVDADKTDIRVFTDCNTPNDYIISSVINQF